MLREKKSKKMKELILKKRFAPVPLGMSLKVEKTCFL